MTPTLPRLPRQWSSAWLAKNRASERFALNIVLPAAPRMSARPGPADLGLNDLGGEGRTRKARRSRRWHAGNGGVVPGGCVAWRVWRVGEIHGTRMSPGKGRSHRPATPAAPARSPGIPHATSRRERKERRNRDEAEGNSAFIWVRGCSRPESRKPGTPPGHVTVRKVPLPLMSPL